jgi:DNA-binding IclR family transcriptional regulator
MQAMSTDPEKIEAGETEDRPRRIQAVDRAVNLLHAVSSSRTPRTVGELADAVGLNRSTAWRLLMTLEHHGLIDRDPVTQRYVIGYEVLRLAASASAHELIASRARPVMDRLAQATEETVSLVVLTPRGNVAIDQSDTRKIATVSVIGVHLPLHATASGKLRLAHATEAEREELLTLPLAQLTERTRTDPEALDEELERVRAEGYALEQDEFESGVSGVGAPIFDSRDRMVAAISIWGLSARLPRPRLEELAPQVVRAADEISDTLREVPPPGAGPSGRRTRSAQA